LHKARLRQCASEFDGIVHDGFRDTPHLITLSEVNELGDFDHISSDVRVFDCQLVGQPGRTWTIGSGRGDENLDVQVLINRRQRFARFLAQIRHPFGDIDKVFDECGELVACRDAEVAHRAF